MGILSDAISAALREHNVPQVGNTGTSPLAQVLRTLLAPRSTEVGAPPDQVQAEPDALRDLVSRLQQSGYGDIINSWLGNGSNQPIEPHQLDHAIGSDRIDQLSSQAGVLRQSLLADLARLLPTVVNSLTPQGRLPEPSSHS